MTCQWLKRQGGRRRIFFLGNHETRTVKPSGFFRKQILSISNALDMRAGSKIDVLLPYDLFYFLSDQRNHRSVEEKQRQRCRIPKDSGRIGIQVVR